MRVSRASGTIEFPADFCWSRARIRVRADARRRSASAATCSARATRAGSRRRCSIASTCASRSSDRAPSRANRRRWSRHGSRRRSPANATDCGARRGGATRTSRPARWSATPRSTDDARAGVARRVLQIRQLTGRGAARIRRVARTIADLDDRTEIDAGDIEQRGLDARGPVVSRQTHRWERGADFPIRDADELDAMFDAKMPRVLLGEGDRPDAFDAPRIAIVGTRAATPMGIADAHEIGAFCARAGITVISGLAIGIDGAAHTGALDAGGLTVGVVATGLDVVYPRRHAAALRAGARAGPDRRRERLRHPAAAVALPDPQSNHRRAGRRGRGRRGDDERRRAHHRERRGPFQPRCVRVARLAPESRPRPAATRCCSTAPSRCSTRPTCCSRSGAGGTRRGRLDRRRRARRPRSAGGAARARGRAGDDRRDRTAGRRSRRTARPACGARARRPPRAQTGLWWPSDDAFAVRGRVRTCPRGSRNPGGIVAPMKCAGDHAEWSTRGQLSG